MQVPSTTIVETDILDHWITNGNHQPLLKSIESTLSKLELYELSDIREKHFKCIILGCIQSASNWSISSEENVLKSNGSVGKADLIIRKGSSPTVIIELKYIPLNCVRAPNKKLKKKKKPPAGLKSRGKGESLQKKLNYLQRHPDIHGLMTKTTEPTYWKNASESDNPNQLYRRMQTRTVNEILDDAKKQVMSYTTVGGLPPEGLKRYVILGIGNRCIVINS